MKVVAVFLLISGSMFYGIFKMFWPVMPKGYTRASESYTGPPRVPTPIIVFS